MFFCDIILVYILDTVDPLVLLLRCGGGDAVHHVVPFHYSPISFCLTRLYQLTTVVGDVQLKAVLLEEYKNLQINDHDDSTTQVQCYPEMQTYWFSWIFNLADAKVFQGNDASWLLILLKKGQKLFCF